jgi:hypothetical protein
MSFGDTAREPWPGGLARVSERPSVRSPHERDLVIEADTGLLWCQSCASKASWCTSRTTAGRVRLFLPEVAFLLEGESVVLTAPVAATKRGHRHHARHPALRRRGPGRRESHSPSREILPVEGRHDAELSWRRSGAPTRGSRAWSEYLEASTTLESSS